MSSHDVDYDNIEMPGECEVSGRYNTFALALVAVGALAFIGGLFALDNPRRVWNAYLMGFWFTFTLGLSGPFLLATQYVSTGTWGVSIRRVLEAFGTFLAPAAILGVIMLLGAADILPWIGIEDKDVAHHVKEFVGLKLGFLNMTGLALTTVIGPIVLLGLFYLIRRNSLKQDESGDPELTDTNKALSAIFLVCFAIVFSLMSWYWLISLEPMWYATMWQVYNFAALFQSGLALATIVVLLLLREEVFGDFVGEYQIHSLGQLVFAFTVFYAYIAFSQFMLCWYANIPEEALFYVRRLGGLTPGDEPGGYGWFTALWLLKFIAPFLILLPQEIKKNKGNILYYVCWVIVAVQIYEIWWWVAFSTSDPGPTTQPTLYLPWLELLVVGGFVGLFMYVVGRSLSSANVLPEKDPWLHESLEHNLDHHGHDEHDDEWGEALQES